MAVEPDDLTSDDLPDAFDIVAEAMGAQSSADVIRFIRILNQHDYLVGKFTEDDLPELAGALGEVLPQVASLVPGPEGLFGVLCDVPALLRGLNALGFMVVRQPPLRHDYYSMPGGGILATHPADRCQGQPCCVHNPSDHPLRQAPMEWMAEQRLMIRTCAHGLNHPDPDHLSWLRTTGAHSAADVQTVHRCDGCCGVYAQPRQEGAP